MPPIKQQLAHLKNARFALVEHFKKQKLVWSQSINNEQLHIEDNQFRTSNTSNKEDRKSVWFQNESANKTDFDSECSRKSDEGELDCKRNESRIEKEAVLEIQLEEIQQNRKKEKKLQKEYGKDF